MILITGKSTLASNLSSCLTGSVVVGRPEYDFSLRTDCDRLVADYPKPTVIINTFGAVTHDSWDSLTTNLVAPAYITNRYYEALDCGHIINISSASSWWSSYPGISKSKFWYGVSKLGLSEFGRQYNRMAIDDSKNVTISTVEPGKFQSTMSNFTGLDIENIVELVLFCIKTKCQHVSLVK